MSRSILNTSPFGVLRTEYGLILEDYCLSRIRNGETGILLVMRKSPLDKLDVLNSSTVVFQVILIFLSRNFLGWYPTTEDAFLKYLGARKSKEGAMKDKLLTTLM